MTTQELTTQTLLDKAIAQKAGNKALLYCLEHCYGTNIVSLYCDRDYWIEENRNYPPGEGNLFLSKATDNYQDWNCVGGVDGSGDLWTATITKPYDVETDSDCTVVFVGDRDDAIAALWAARHQAYLD